MIATQSVGIRQIGKNPGFIFQTSSSRSSEVESIGEILNRGGESSCDDMGNTTTRLTIDSQIGITAFYGQGISPLGMLLSQRDVSFHPGKVDIRPTRYDVSENVNLAALQRKDAIEEWARLIYSTQHHQHLAAHRSQPGLDIETQRL